MSPTTLARSRGAFRSVLLPGQSLNSRISMLSSSMLPSGPRLTP
jgi:hypothetical protein